MRLTGAEERRGLAKVGRGARGARGDGGGHAQRRGPHATRRGRIPPSIIHGGESSWRGEERLPVPLQPNRTETGPDGGIPGGRAGLGAGALRPGSREFAGRRGGDRAGPRTTARGGGGLGWPGGKLREAPGGGARVPERGRSVVGGGIAPCPGDDGGGGHVSPIVGPCQFMAAQHANLCPTLRAGVHCLGVRGGGAWGGGGRRWWSVPSLGGGSPAGALSGVAQKP